MAKKNNQGIWIFLGIIVAAFIIAPNLGQTSYSITNQDILNQLENMEQGDCSVSLDNLVITQGDLAGGTITAEPNIICDVYASDGTTWNQVASGRTSVSGLIHFEDNLDVAGTFSFKAICGSCLTNTVNLKVNPPVTPPSDDGYNVGDNVGSGTSGSGGSSFGDDLINEIVFGWDTGGPYVLGAKITRSWNYQDQEVIGPEQYPVEWTLYDSNGMRWQTYDYVPVSNVEVIVCPVTYHPDAPWKFVISNGIQGGLISYSWNVQPYICEVNE